MMGYDAFIAKVIAELGTYFPGVSFRLSTDRYYLLADGKAVAEIADYYRDYVTGLSPFEDVMDGVLYDVECPICITLDAVFMG